MYVDGWTDGWTAGWMDGWMDRRMDGWMDGWVYVDNLVEAHCYGIGRTGQLLNNCPVLGICACRCGASCLFLVKGHATGGKVSSMAKATLLLYIATSLSCKAL